MATLKSKPLVTSCSSTYHAMSTNTMITSRGNSTTSTIDYIQPVMHSRSTSYDGATPPTIILGNSAITNKGFHDYLTCSTHKAATTSILTVQSLTDTFAHYPDQFIGDAVICHGGMRETSSHFKNIATAAGFGDSTTTKGYTSCKDDHDHDHSRGGDGAQMIASRAVMSNGINVAEAGHDDQCSGIVDDRAGRTTDASRRQRRSKRNCKSRSPLSLGIIQKSRDVMKGKSSCSEMGAVMHGWLQAMRETSPPRITSPTSSSTSACADSYSTKSCTSSHCKHGALDSTNSTECEDLQSIHRAWMLKHPSALDKLEEIVEAASGKRVAVFLDYDGTLSPIVEDPDRAVMSHQMRAIVKEVANVFPTAIISGRCKEKLNEFVQLPELFYAGSHGMDIIGPTKPYHLEEACEKGKEVILFQPAKEFTYMMDEVFEVLKEKTKAVPGARVDHNKFCVSVHFRCVKERNWIALAEQVHQVIKSYPNLRLTQGRKVLEIRPLIAWNKGKALDYLLKAMGLGDQNTVFPIYLGDDRSDEDAFKVLNRKKHGLGILVTTVAKETNAVCSLRDPSEVGELLKRLVKWKSWRLNKFCESS